MSVTTFTVTCPICDCPGSGALSTRTHEEWILCGFCGWQYQYVVTNKDDWKKPDFTPEYVTLEMTSPIGVGYLKDKESVKTEIHLLKDREEENHFRNIVRDNIIDIEIASISKYIDGQIIVENCCTGETAQFNPQYVKERCGELNDRQAIGVLLNSSKIS